MDRTLVGLTSIMNPQNVDKSIDLREVEDMAMKQTRKRADADDPIAAFEMDIKKLTIGGESEAKRQTETESSPTANPSTSASASASVGSFDISSAVVLTGKQSQPQSSVGPRNGGRLQELFSQLGIKDADVKRDGSGDVGHSAPANASKSSRASKSSKSSRSSQSTRSSGSTDSDDDTDSDEDSNGTTETRSSSSRASKSSRSSRTSDSRWRNRRRQRYSDEDSESSSRRHGRGGRDSHRHGHGHSHDHSHGRISALEYAKDRIRMSREYKPHRSDYALAGEIAKNREESRTSGHDADMRRRMDEVAKRLGASQIGVVQQSAEAERDTKGRKLEQIAQLKMNLQEEGIDCKFVGDLSIKSTVEEIDSTLTMLRLKSDTIRYSTLAEEIIIGAAEAIESIFDGSRKIPILNMQPDYRGYHTTVAVKLQRMKTETAEVVHHAVSAYNIGPTTRIALELLPSLLMYPRINKHAKSQPGIHTDASVSMGEIYNADRNREASQLRGI